jgi:hypothetical protein
MKKVPSYLKGLAETRARVSADVARYQGILDEVTASLAEAQAQMDACDRLIKKFDVRLDPCLIQPIRAWKGRYGDRGALKATVDQYLESVAPQVVTTTEICWEVQNRLKLDFPSVSERRRWVDNSLRSRLKTLVTEGLVERLLPGTLGLGRFGGWRWKQEGAQTLGGLAAMAAAAGVGVRVAEDEELAQASSDS